jgi:hypothetical protein
MRRAWNTHPTLRERKQAQATRRGIAAIFLVAAVGLVAAGCGETLLDASKTQDELKENVERAQRTKVASVKCPSGVQVKAGATFECTVELRGGKTETATLKITNSSADTEVTEIKPGK